MPRPGSGDSLGVWNPVVFADVRQRILFFHSVDITLLTNKVEFVLFFKRPTDALGCMNVILLHSN